MENTEFEQTPEQPQAEAGPETGAQTPAETPAEASEGTVTAETGSAAETFAEASEGAAIAVAVAAPPAEPPPLKKRVEALLFITDHPITLARMCAVVAEKNQDAVRAAIEELKADYEAQGSVVQVLEIAEGYQMATRGEAAPYVRKLYSERMVMRLSTAALETLSIISYKQPLTRAEIEEIRGVEVIAALETLLEKRLVKVVGRKEAVGRPLLYGTTPEFLRHFGLRSLGDLPPIDSFTPPEEPKEDRMEGPFAMRSELDGTAPIDDLIDPPATPAETPTASAQSAQVEVGSAESAEAAQPRPEASGAAAEGPSEPAQEPDADAGAESDDDGDLTFEIGVNGGHSKTEDDEPSA